MRTMKRWIWDIITTAIVVGAIAAVVVVEWNNHGGGASVCPAAAAPLELHHQAPGLPLRRADRVSYRPIH